jgi:hypothetical protein
MNFKEVEGRRFLRRNLSSNGWSQCNNQLLKEPPKEQDFYKQLKGFPASSALGHPPKYRKIEV